MQYVVIICLDKLHLLCYTIIERWVNIMKMSNDFKQIIALLLANNVRFNLDYGIESYFLTKNNENGLHIWEIDDKNKDNGYKIIFWDKEYNHQTFHLPIDYVINACAEEKQCDKR